VTTRSFERHAEQFLAALAYPLTSATRALASGGVAAVTYVFLVLSSFPAYSIQMLASDLWYLDDAVVALTANTYATVGAVGLGLVVSYAILTGVAVTTAVGQVRRTGLSGTSGLSTALPGLLASGCASCGAGLLGLLGFAGALAALPFHGNLLRVGGLVLLGGYLARVGDPRHCTVAPDDAAA
jgi:hypothetical protein